MLIPVRDKTGVLAWSTADLAPTAGRVFKIKNLSDVDATLLEPASCAAHGLDKIAPKMGSSVLMFGAGPTGLVRTSFNSSFRTIDFLMHILGSGPDASFKRRVPRRRLRARRSENELGEVSQCG